MYLLPVVFHFLQRLLSAVRIEDFVIVLHHRLRHGGEGLRVVRCQEDRFLVIPGRK